MTTEQSLLASVFSKLSGDLAERDRCRMIVTVSFSTQTRAQAMAVAIRALNPTASVDRLDHKLRIDSSHWESNAALTDDIAFLWDSPDVNGASIRRVSEIEPLQNAS